MNDVQIYDIEQAHQSNFRLINLITDLSRDVLTINEKIDQETALRLSKITIEILCQATYTSRSLGGVLSPNKAVHTCQKAVAKDVIAVLRADKAGKQQHGKS